MQKQNAKQGKKMQALAFSHTGPKGYFYDIDIINDPRSILFMGKDGIFLRVDEKEVIYLSGNTGNQFNTRISSFQTTPKSI
jgi:hypothetical protein